MLVVINLNYYSFRGFHGKLLDSVRFFNDLKNDFFKEPLTLNQVCIVLRLVNNVISVCNLVKSALEQRKEVLENEKKVI